VKEEPVCLNELFAKTAALFDIKAKRKNITLSFSKGYGNDASTTLSDEYKLNRIVNNLLENAIKFTEKGSVEFGFQFTGSNEIEIFVRDTGIGISRDKLESIFDRFSQEEKELSRKAGGLGLGLSIAKENATLLGGSIRVASEKHKGSAFIVTLPYKPVQKPEMTSSALPWSGKTAMTILVAEDEENNFIFIDTLLTDKLNLDCKILRAHDGNEAVEMFKSNNSIDLILMDLKMPQKSGFEAISEIRELNTDIPIIALTAYSAQNDIEKALLCGCNKVVSKPIQLDVFKSIMQKYN